MEQDGWSGDGDVTAALVTALAGMDGVVLVRVEDSPASRADSGYAFISNEIYVQSATRETVVDTRRLGVIPWRTRVAVPIVAFADLEARLGALDEVGPPDYADEDMIQYLRTHRVVAPYQTRGVKVVEMVRIYEAGRGPCDEASGRAQSS